MLDQIVLAIRVLDTDMKTDITYDVKAIVARFGGRSDICLRLETVGYKVTKRAVDKWIERKQIPSGAFVAMAVLGYKEDKLFDLTSYIVLPEKN